MNVVNTEPRRQTVALPVELVRRINMVTGDALVVSGGAVVISQTVTAQFLIEYALERLAPDAGRELANRVAAEAQDAEVSAERAAVPAGV